MLFSDVAGQCPPVPEGSVGICVEECISDFDCYPGSLCCSNGCGHTCQRSYTPGTLSDIVFSIIA